MNKKLKKFEVEELEQRFETGRWVSEVKTGKSNDLKLVVGFLKLKRV